MDIDWVFAKADISFDFSCAIVSFLYLAHMVSQSRDDLDDVMPYV